ncbi:NUDIX hydrolase [Amycolatopsis sp. NPDC059657]|uniref:NUDIX hydrolase n=1 Tax=Amycolatopsis sp. NPDC059657 TaxID=3346899 RepID=UPI0036718B74
MTATPSGSVRCVGGILLDPARGLLLIKRANEPGRGLWSVPGGRVEPGETDTEAVVRELREETGLDVIPRTLVGTVTRGPYEIHDYACDVAGGLLQAGDDASDARWFTLEELGEFDDRGALADRLLVTLRDWDALPAPATRPV